MTFFWQKSTIFVEISNIFLKFKDVKYGDFGWKLTDITCGDSGDFFTKNMFFLQKTLFSALVIHL